jgi:hypothetical protein
MLTEEQKLELDNLVASMQTKGASNEEIQAAVDARKSQMLSSSDMEKPQPVAETTAPAAGQRPDMGSQLESGSSASANNNILPRDPNEVLGAITAMSGAIPLSNDFKKEFVKTIYSGVQSFDYTQAKNRAQKLNDAQAAIEKINNQEQRVIND